jgi:hypothetical protein
MGERGERVFVRREGAAAWRESKTKRPRGDFVARLTFSDDEGVSVTLKAPNGHMGTLAIPFRDDPGIGRHDAAIVEALTVWNVLDAAKGEELIERLAGADRIAWAQRHGLEALLGFPDGELHARTDVELTEKDGVVQVGLPPAPRVSAPVSRSWTDHEREVLRLHIHYWQRVWSMNSMSLFNRYRKHLPPAERTDVDALGHACARGDEDEIARLVEIILSKIWDEDDWLAILRSPKLDDPGTDEDEARAWRRMVGRQ